MKKKTKWLSCLLVLLTALAAVACKSGRKKDETVYRLTFRLADKAGKPCMTAAEAAPKIIRRLQDCGCPFSEYSTGADSQELVFFLIMITEEQIAEIIADLQAELKLPDVTCKKAEHKYRDLIP